MHGTRQRIISVIFVTVSSLLQPLVGREPAQQVTESQAGKATESEIRITPYNPQQGTVLAEYLDNLTGRAVTVKGNVSHDTAVAWLTQLNDTAATKSEQDLAALVTAGQARGLLAVSSLFHDTLITVSWGPPPKRDPPPGMIVTSAQDRSTWVVLVMSKGSMEDWKGWFAAADDAKTGEQLVAVVEAHHSLGLEAVTKRYLSRPQPGKVGLSLRVTAFWSPGGGPK
jgi:hypothetical protein